MNSRDFSSSLVRLYHPQNTSNPRLLTSMQSVVQFGNFEALALQGQITSLRHPQITPGEKSSCFRDVICPKLSPASFRRLETEVLTGSSSAYVSDPRHGTDEICADARKGHDSNVQILILVELKGTAVRWSACTRAGPVEAATSTLAH